MEEKKVLTAVEAIAMLPDGEEIHTFRNSSFALMGADWKRKSLIEALNKYEVEVPGAQAQAMGHGMAFCDDHGWVFVETKKTG